MVLAPLTAVIFLPLTVAAVVVTVPAKGANLFVPLGDGWAVHCHLPPAKIQLKPSLAFPYGSDFATVLPRGSTNHSWPPLFDKLRCVIGAKKALKLLAAMVVPAEKAYVCVVADVEETYCNLKPLRSNARLLGLYSSINSSSASVFGLAGLGNISLTSKPFNPMSLAGMCGDGPPPPVTTAGMTIKGGDVVADCQTTTWGVAVVLAATTGVKLHASKLPICQFCG